MGAGSHGVAQHARLSGSSLLPNSYALACDRPRASERACGPEALEVPFRSLLSSELSPDYGPGVSTSELLGRL